MQGAEDRQGGGEKQIAQGYDLVQAAGPRDIGLRSPDRNQENYDAGGAHRDHRARNPKKCGENGYLHFRWDAEVSAIAVSGRVFPGQYSLELYNGE